MLQIVGHLVVVARAAELVGRQSLSQDCHRVFAIADTPEANLHDRRMAWCLAWRSPVLFNGGTARRGERCGNRATLRTASEALLRRGGLRAQRLRCSTRGARIDPRHDCRT